MRLGADTKPIKDEIWARAEIVHLAGIVEILGIWANFAPSLNLDSSAILVYSALVHREVPG